MSRHRLHELHVGARGDEARDAGVAEIMEAVAGLGEAGGAKRRRPHAAVEVREVKRRRAFGREDELVRRVAPALERARGERLQGRLDGGKQGDGPRPRLRLRAAKLPARVGALDPDEAPLALNVAPAKGAEFAEAKAERDAE